MVECDLAKVEVAGSNPVSRSRNSSKQPVPPRFASHKASVRVESSMERTAAFWVAISLSCLGMLGCGNSNLTSVSLSPTVADAQNFPGGQVQFTATGTYSGSSKVVPLKNITWCIGSATGACNGNIAAAASVDGNGLAQCLPGATGTVTVLAGSGGPPSMPDMGHQLSVFGTAQLTCP